MELNLDEEYYNKYIKYKKRYLMLKQLKNNNDLEGGWFWPFTALFGTGETPIVENKEPQVEQGPTYGPKMYLVFTISENDLTDPSKLTQFTDLTLKSAMKRTLQQINTNNESDQGDQANQDDQNTNNETNDKIKIFMKCDKFFETYTDAFLLFKKNEIWYSRLLNKDTNKMTFTFQDVESYLEPLKIKITGFPSKDGIPSEDILPSLDDKPQFPKFTYGSKNTEDNTMNNEIISFINNQIQLYVENNNNYLEDKIRTFKENIKKNEKMELLETFGDKELPSNLDPDLIIKNEKFLVRFNKHFSASPKAVPQNMILEIKPYTNGDIDFTYDKLSDITASNQTFLDISATISNKLAADNRLKETQLAEKEAAFQSARQSNREKVEAEKQARSLNKIT
jgi:hypothetical protein